MIIFYSTSSSNWSTKTSSEDRYKSRYHLCFCVMQKKCTDIYFWKLCWCYEGGLNSRLWRRQVRKNHDDNMIMIVGRMDNIRERERQRNASNCKNCRKKGVCVFLIVWKSLWFLKFKIKYTIYSVMCVL